MENDVLKNKIAPWQEKGRWYHATVLCDGTTWSIDKTKSDKLFENSYFTSGYYLKIDDPELNTYKHIVVDVKLKIKNAIASGLLTLYSGACNIYYLPLSQYIIFTNANTVGNNAFDMWIFVSE